MSLITQIESDITSAMKAREQEKLDALRMVRAAFQNEQIALGHELTEAEAHKVISRLIKQRRDSAEQYRAGDRTEQADKEEAEAKLLEAYLPAQLSDDDLRSLVTEAISATGANGAADFGKVMGAVMAKTQGAADGNRVSALVREALQ